MNTQYDALKLALEALENLKEIFTAMQEFGIRAGRSAKQMRVGEVLIHDRAIIAIKQALEVPVQPVISAGTITPAMQAGQTTEQKEQMVRAMQSAYPAVQPAPVQETVAWAWRAFDPDDGHFGKWGTWHISDYKPPRQQSRWFQVVPLPDTTPPAAQRQWVGLTDEEINELDYSGTRAEFVRAIEAKLREKNTFH